MRRSGESLLVADDLYPMPPVFERHATGKSLHENSARWRRGRRRAVANENHEILGARAAEAVLQPGDELMVRDPHGGAGALARGRPPGRPWRDQGVARGPGGPPHHL